VEVRKKALHDALWALASVIGAGVLFVRHDAAEQISPKLVRWERMQLDDLLLTAAVAVLAACWFALRRWRETLRELHAREQTELEKARYVERLEQLSSQVLETEQRERARLADLLHDDVGQTLFACRLQLEHARERAPDPALEQLIDEAHALASAAMTSTRELTMQISPAILRDLGLKDALDWLCARTEQRFGLRVQLEPSAAWSRLTEPVIEPVFHSVGELLTNAAKHARARQVEISAAISGEGAVLVSVHDDGRGFSLQRERSHGFGLLSIERRMACLGASLRLQSSPEHGTLAQLVLPLTAARASSPSSELHGPMLIPAVAVEPQDR
jgi:signal transduction histidine kinase